MLKEIFLISIISISFIFLIQASSAYNIDDLINYIQNMLFPSSQPAVTGGYSASCNRRTSCTQSGWNDPNCCTDFPVCDDHRCCKPEGYRADDPGWCCYGTKSGGALCAGKSTATTTSSTTPTTSLTPTTTCNLDTGWAEARCKESCAQVGYGYIYCKCNSGETTCDDNKYYCSGSSYNSGWPTYRCRQSSTTTTTTKQVKYCEQLLNIAKTAMNSKCGDDNYNKIADIDKDGKINLVDFASISGHYYDETWCENHLNDLTNPCETKKCTDSDGGINFYKKGICTDSGGSYADSCWYGFIREFQCINDLCVGGTYECPNGYECKNGECVQSFTTTTTPTSTYTSTFTTTSSRTPTTTTTSSTTTITPTITTTNPPPTTTEFGTNIYNLYNYPNSDIDSFISCSKSHEIKIIRIMIKNLEPNSVGVYDDSVLQKMDYVMKKAESSGVKLIIVFSDMGWDLWHADINSKSKYYSLIPLENDGTRDCIKFYTDQNIIDKYKNRINHILNHYNSYLGCEWKDCNVVYAWELSNEPGIKSEYYDYYSSGLPGCKRYSRGSLTSDYKFQILSSWTKEINDYVKDSGVKSQIAFGAAGSCLITGIDEGDCPEKYTNDVVPNLDILTIHTYWTKNIEKEISLAKSTGKKVLLEEFGETVNNDDIDQFYSYMINVAESNSIGSLFWAFGPVNCNNLKNGYTIYEHNIYPPEMNPCPDIPGFKQKMERVFNVIDSHFGGTSCQAQLELSISSCQSGSNCNINVIGNCENGLLIMTNKEGKPLQTPIVQDISFDIKFVPISNGKIRVISICLEPETKVFRTNFDVY